MTTKTAVKAKAAAKSTKPDNLWSQSKLAVAYGISRETVVKRFRRAGMLPHPSSTATEKLYENNELTRVALTRDDDESAEYKVKGLDLKNRKAEIELAKLEGTVVSVDEVSQLAADLFGGLQKKITIQNVKNLVKKIRAAKDESGAVTIAQTILNQPFLDARENHRKFLGE